MNELTDWTCCLVFAVGLNLVIIGCVLWDEPMATLRFLRRGTR